MTAGAEPPSVARLMVLRHIALGRLCGLVTADDPFQVQAKAWDQVVAEVWVSALLQDVSGQDLIEVDKEHYMQFMAQVDVAHVLLKAADPAMRDKLQPLHQLHSRNRFRRG